MLPGGLIHTMLPGGIFNSHNVARWFNSHNDAMWFISNQVFNCYYFTECFLSIASLIALLFPLMKVELEDEIPKQSKDMNLPVELSDAEDAAGRVEPHARRTTQTLISRGQQVTTTAQNN